MDRLADQEVEALEPERCPVQAVVSCEKHDPNSARCERRDAASVLVGLGTLGRGYEQLLGLRQRAVDLGTLDVLEACSELAQQLPREPELTVVQHQHRWSFHGEPSSCWTRPRPPDFPLRSSAFVARAALAAPGTPIDRMPERRLEYVLWDPARGRRAC